MAGDERGIAVLDRHSDFDTEFQEPDPATDKLVRFYQDLRNKYISDRTQTLKLKIPQALFNQLQDRPGIRGPGFNRTFQEVDVDGDTDGWYLLFPPHVSRSELIALNRPPDEIFIAPNILPDGKFQITPISSQEGPRRDISELEETYFPAQDIIEAELVSADEYVRVQPLPYIKELGPAPFGKPSYLVKLHNK